MSAYPLPPATDFWTASYPASLASPSSSADLYEQHGAPPYTPPMMSDWALPRRMSSKGKEREHVDVKAFAVGNVDLSYHAADIVCHLLYSNDLTPTSSPPSSSYHIYPSVTRSTIAQIPSVDFRNFVRTTITTTAVSQAVIIMSMWYIYKLRLKCKGTWNPGSEFRMMAIGLVLANKYLDDSTYTSKTWSNVTHIPLPEMNASEVVFLSALNHEMGIEEPEYYLWVQSINAFINATYHQSQTLPSYSIPSDYQFTFQSSYPTPPYQDVSFNTAPRARSTSPRRTIQRTTTQPTYHRQLAEVDNTSMASIPPPSVSGRKRSAGDVFSPDVTRIRKTRSSALAMAEYPQSNSSVVVLPPISQMQISGLQYSAAPSPVRNQLFAQGQDDQYPAPVYQQMPPMADYGYGITDAYLNANMLQAPYIYQSGPQQPRPEDLTFFTLAASPINDEFQRQQHAEYVARMGKPRVPHHGLYQSSAATPYSNDVRSTTMPYRQYNQLPLRRPMQTEAVRRLSAPHINYLGGGDDAGYDFTLAPPPSAGYAAYPPLSGSIPQQSQGYPSVDPLLSSRY